MNISTTDSNYVIKYSELKPVSEKKAPTRLKQYIRYLIEKQSTEYVTQSNIRMFLQFMRQTGWTKPCGNNYLRNLRTVIKKAVYLWHEERNIANHFQYSWADFFNRLEIKKPKKTINPAALPTRERILQMIETEMNPQKQLIIAFFYNTGMRPIEISSVRVTDVSRTVITKILPDNSKIDFHTVRVFSTKTQAERLVPVDAGLIEDILKILTPKEFLFELPTGKPFDYMRLYRLIRTASTDERGLWLNPYKLREAHATHTHELVGDIHLNASTLGHSPDINMRVYVQPMSIIEGSHKIVQAFPYTEMRESIRRFG